MGAIKKRVGNLLSQMTLEEKLAQIGSYWVYELQTEGVLDMEKAASKLKHGIGQISRVGGASTNPPRQTAALGNRIQKFLVEETRLGIPAILHEEACSGAVMLGGSMFPQMIGLASTFQPELAERMTQVIRNQLLAVGAREALAPVLDVARDPRWGRLEETFGEDPLLVSQFGMAYIKGMQGDDLTKGVLATAKHFIGHAFSMGGLNCAPVQLGTHEIHDVYLPPFEAAIREAGVTTMMNAYPEIDGEVVAANERILTDLLRGKLGFDGLVVSDYEAVIMLHNYHMVAAKQSIAGRMALQAGIDVELPTTVCYGNPLKAALEAGEVSIETIDLAVFRHLQKKFELGLFETPYVNEEIVLDSFETKQDRALAAEIANQSMVLLKNDGTLPLQKNIGTLAVIGPNADFGRSQLGDYSYASMFELNTATKAANSDFVHPDMKKVAENSIHLVSVLDGIKAAVSPQTRVLYAKGCENDSLDKSGFADAINAADQADAVVLVLGDLSGLGPDCTTGEFHDRAGLDLPGVQRELVEAVVALGKPVVVVLVNGRVFTIPWLDQQANSILEAWLPGEEGGTAVASILFGEKNPGGKLPISFPYSVGQVPTYYNHKPSGMRSIIYGGYSDEPIGALYPFGHGLSYTQFSYEDLFIEKEEVGAGESVEIALTVKNIGPVAGEEVVQLYTRDVYASLPRPVKELKGFVRLCLQPGEAKQVTFHLPVDLLAFVDRDLNLVLEAGTIKVMLGSSSEDIRLEGAFEISGMDTASVANRLFECPVSVQTAGVVSTEYSFEKSSS
jgi:beta-glucosidase